MSLGKKDIVKNISSKALISLADSQIFFDNFISLIKIKSTSHIIKLSGFGSFHRKVSPRRKGRNPKTLQEYQIPSKNKIHFYPSNKVKTNLN